VDREQCWSVIEQERLRLAALLESLAPEEWERPSLCTGWRIKDVAAHVALAPQPPSIARMLVAGVQARGRFHTLNHGLAVRHADRPLAALVAEIREHASSRRLPSVTNYRNILFDIMVHAQDIAIPLDRPHPMPVEAARAGADWVWTMGWPFWARRRLREYRLAATDTDWTVGQGALIEGPAEALLLLLTGRTVSSDQLSGPGAARLRL
jgi:uncharacterized protein (TIGR03083 family)